MTDFSKVQEFSIPEGNVVMLQVDGVIVWDNRYGYVSLGDSIAAGHTIDSDWESDYGEDSQYGVNGNTSTEIVPNCYTYLIDGELKEERGSHMVRTESFARSGDTVADLMVKLSQGRVMRAIRDAKLVTVCIGANDVLEPAMMHLGDYINTGDLSEIEVIVEQNLTRLDTDSDPNSYKALVNRLRELNPNAEIAFMTVYNPYKYLYLEDGQNGFFGPVLNSIPQMTILGFEVDEFIKDGLLNTPAVRTLYSRVNGLGEWAERYVTRLNDIIERKVVGTGMFVADAKTLFDGFPDRPVSALKHYNDLVSVEYTRGYDTMQMDWGRLYGDDVAGFWLGLAGRHTSTSGFDLIGFATELVALTIVNVIVPDIDPHPETYGHYVLERAFADALGWESLDRYTITYNANGGSGTMSGRTILGVDGLSAYVELPSSTYTAPDGYYFKGWNTKADGTGNMYASGTVIQLTGNLALHAQWSNEYTLTYKHTNATELYGDDETGHQECYNLYINGELKPKFGTFASGSSTTYTVPYGSTIRVVVSNYNGGEFLYDDKDCSVYLNGTRVANGYRGTEYTFTLTGNTTVDFWWEIAGSLATFNAQSWEDCYITT